MDTHTETIPTTRHVRSPKRHDRRSARIYRAILKPLAGLALGATLLAAIGHVASAENNGDVPVIPFERYTLDNGIEVILHQDKSVPLVAVSVWYHVGSGDEVPGKSGFAHLFEHMLFQGSKHVGADRHFAILKDIGASSVNGTTNTDRTNYFEVVPSHQLETSLWLESDRMGFLLPLLTKESLDNQIEVVRNERRQRYENVAYRTTWIELHKLLYPEGHPYRYLTIGRHEDLTSATLDDVRAFYKTWYVPANATIALAGDFEIPQAKTLIQKWFGGFPKSARPMHQPVPMPKLKKLETLEVSDPIAKLPMLTYAWHTPAAYAEGDAEFEVLAHALGATGTGRLYKTLVHEKQLAQQVSVWQTSRQFSSAFGIQVTLRSGADPQEVARLVKEEIERVRAQGVTVEEIRRAVTALEANTIWGLESLLGRTETLQAYNHYLGRPDFLRENLERYASVTTDRVRAEATTYLRADAEVNIVTVPAGPSQSAPEKAPAAAQGGSQAAPGGKGAQ